VNSRIGRLRFALARYRGFCSLRADWGGVVVFNGPRAALNPAD